MATIITAPHWTITTTGDTVSVACNSHGQDRAAHLLPRVWSGRGLGLPEADIPGFSQALAEAMKLGASEPPTDHTKGETSAWSPPRYDPDDAFVYIAGPCQLAENLPGYLPTTTFTIAHANVAGLCARLTTYLQERDRNAAGAEFERRTRLRRVPRARSST